MFLENRCPNLKKEGDARERQGSGNRDEKKRQEEVVMHKCWMILFLAVFLMPNTAPAEAPPTEVWVRNFDLGNDDWGEAIAVDGAGFVYVSGNTYNGADYDWLTIKYTPNGDTAWTRVYDSGLGEDLAQDLAVDNAGNVYVVGWSPDTVMIHDWRMIKYDTDGTVLWNKIRDWAADADQGCHDIVVDTVGGYLYMTGDYIHTGGTWDYLTVKCDLDGNYQGENGWSGGAGINNNAWAITADDAMNIYITGDVWNATRDWGTVKYDSNLNLLWNVTYDSGADDNIPPSAIAVDHTGNVFLVGWAENATTDWQIVKYSSSGVFLWEETLDTLGADEGAWGVVVDHAGYFYVNGDFDTGMGWDCRTIKCDGDGNIQWDVTYDGGLNYNDAGRGLAIDDSGYIYVVGHSYNGMTVDYLIIKYQQQTGIAEQFTAGRPSLLSLEALNNPSSAPVLKYNIPAGVEGRLSFYSADGRRIDEFLLNSSQSIFTWDAGELPCGVYFGRLESGNQSRSAKICLTK
jgi:hypothetical protein